MFLEKIPEILYLAFIIKRVVWNKAKAGNNMEMKHRVEKSHDDEQVKNRFQSSINVTRSRLISLESRLNY